MAFTEFYCRATDGSNLNAGSEDAAAARLTYASGDWVAATGVFTVAASDPVADGVVVGDFASVYADGSTVTGFVGRVTARTTTTITVSLTAKSGTPPVDGTGNRTLKIGGGWRGANGAEAFPIGFIETALTNAAGNPYRVNWKNDGTYNVTAAMVHNLLGPGRLIQGYTTTPGDGGRATIDGGGSGTSYTVLSISQGRHYIADCVFNRNGATGSAALLNLSAGAAGLDRVVVSNGMGTLISCGNIHHWFNEIELFGGAGAGISGGGAYLKNGIIHDMAGAGLQLSAFFAPSVVEDTVLDRCQHGITLGGTNAQLVCSGVDFYDHTLDGINVNDFSGGQMLNLVNCNFVKNGRYGVGGSGGAQIVMGRIANCGFGRGTQANTSGDISAAIPSGFEVIDSVNYANDVTPWVDPANGDFRIALAAAQAAGRGAFLQTAPGYAGTVAYPDIGAGQSRLTDAEIAEAVWTYVNRTLT